MSMLSRMQHELNRFFHGVSSLPSQFEANQSLLGSEWKPCINLQEDNTHYTVTVDVPGAKLKDIQVSVEHGLFTVKGERTSEKEEKGKHYCHKECLTSSFERSFRLPDTADGDKITATGKNGAICIRIGKKEALTMKRMH